MLIIRALKEDDIHQHSTVDAIKIKN